MFGTRLQFVTVLAIASLFASARASTGTLTRVAVLSDLNGSYGSVHYDAPVHAALKRVLQVKPDLVLVTGDMVAGQMESLSSQQVLKMWKGFHAAVTEPLRKAGIPLAVTPGNHDASPAPRFQKEREIYRQQWKSLPERVKMLEAQHYPFRYAFTSGGVLFVSLDVTATSSMNAEQRQWLEKILAENTAYKTKILFSHLPLYPFAQQREQDYVGTPELEAMLSRHGVTMYLSGHHHAYYPGKRGALRLVGTGCLGGGRRKLIGDARLSDSSFLLMELDEFGNVALDAYRGPSMSEKIPRANLPRSVGQGSLRVVRDDLD